MSPGSPLTPRRAEALHTPTQASISSVLDSDNNSDCDGLAPYDADGEVEPLSATLKALGAKRRTERFPSTCVPVHSPVSATADGFDALQHLKSPFSESELTGNQERFQVMTATRKIFHLPTWVRFEANHHARSRAADENRKAAQEFSKLHLAPTKSIAEAEVIRGEALPKTSCLGDVAPNSPNGDLFAGFEVDEKTSMTAQEEAEWVVKVVRRPTMAALREMDASTGPTKAGGGRMFGAIRSALPGLRPQHRIKALRPLEPSTTLVPGHSSGIIDDKERRDGWGGILTRSSWFPSHAKGPLVSPSSLTSAKKNKGLKKMLLQPSFTHQNRKTPVSEEDEWEDIPEVPATSPAPRSFLELNDAPRFFNAPHDQRPSHTQQRGWFRFLSRDTPSTSHRSTKEKDAWVDETELNVWRTTPLPPTKDSDEVVASQIVTKGTRSIENRPLTDGSKGLSLRVQVAMVAVTAILLAVIVGNVVILSRTHSAPEQVLQQNSTSKSLNNLGLGIVTPSTTADQLQPITGVESDQARQSSIAKAAQLSQPWL